MLSLLRRHRHPLGDPPLLMVQSLRYHAGKGEGQETDSDQHPQTDAQQDHDLFTTDAQGLHSSTSSSDSPAMARMRHQRDRAYSQRRPLPTVPWLQLRSKTYLDDAERLYGRKETWPQIQDPQLRMRLRKVLLEYLEAVTEQTFTEARDARRMQRRCRQLQEEYRGYIAAGLANPQILRTWELPRWLLEKQDTDEQRTTTQASSTMLGASSSSSSSIPHEGEKDEDHAGEGMDRITEEDDEERNQQFREQREARLARRGADLTQANDEVPEKERRPKQYSSFPFLRQRAIDRSSTLDSSLVDWTAKYFPDDDYSTFKERAAPSSSSLCVGEEGAESEGGAPGEKDGAAAQEQRAAMARRRVTDRLQLLQQRNNDPLTTAAGHPKRSKKQKPMDRLRVTFAQHQDANRAVFDGQGLFYRKKSLDGMLMQQQDGAMMESPTSLEKMPKPIRASRTEQPRRSGQQHHHADDGVVRVDWNTVMTAQRSRKTPRVHEAREKLVRLGRGENPQTI